MTAKQKHAVVLFSGGVDSSTLLYQLRFEDFEPLPLFVDYGQRHARERTAAEAVCAASRAPLMRVQLASALTPVFASARSSQVGLREDVPHGHYADDSMRTTIVPNRNMLLIAVAGAYGLSVGADCVAYAAHAGDHPIYPDCRPEFATIMSEALALASGIESFRLYRPFINISKTDIVKRGMLLRVPFDLTYSCYEGREAHCGLCGTCVERREAFREAGAVDPTTYETAEAL